jgi:hypothetical protein
MNIQCNSNSFPVTASTVSLSTCGTNPSTIIVPAGLGNYSWSSSQFAFTPNYTAPSPTNNVFVTNQTGTVQLSIAPSAGCPPVTTTISIVATPAPSLSVFGNLNVCFGATTTLTGGGATTYTWSSGSTSNTINISPASTGTFQLTGTNIDGCFGSKIFTVQVLNTPTLTAIGSASVCVGSSATYSLTGANVYSLNASQISNTLNVLPSISTTYTITGMLGNGCTDTLFHAVTVNPNCSDVWPGDANSDGTANTQDVLELGLHIGQTGSSRSVVSNLWQSFYCAAWAGTMFNGKNVNHSDCNGDGVITTADTLAVFNNYGLTHPFKQSPISNPQIKIVPDQSYVQSGQWGSASIYAGDQAGPISMINGLAFSINFDESYIETDSVLTEFPVSFLDDGISNLHFRKSQFSSGLYHCVTTHTNGGNVNGFGKVGSFYFKVKSSLSFDTILTIKISEGAKSSSQGVISALTVGQDTTVKIGITVGLNETAELLSPEIYPNPAEDLVTIKN